MLRVGYVLHEQQLSSAGTDSATSSSRRTSSHGNGLPSTRSTDEPSALHPPAWIVLLAGAASGWAWTPTCASSCSRAALGCRHHRPRRPRRSAHPRRAGRPDRRRHRRRLHGLLGLRASAAVGDPPAGADRGDHPAGLRASGPGRRRPGSPAWRCVCAVHGPHPVRSRSLVIPLLLAPLLFAAVGPRDRPAGGHSPAGSSGSSLSGAIIVLTILPVDDLQPRLDAQGRCSSPTASATPPGWPTATSVYFGADLGSYDIRVQPGARGARSRQLRARPPRSTPVGGRRPGRAGVGLLGAVPADRPRLGVAAVPTVGRTASGLFEYWVLVPFAVAGVVVLRRRRRAGVPAAWSFVGHRGRHRRDHLRRDPLPRRRRGVHRAARRGRRSTPCSVDGGRPRRPGRPCRADPEPVAEERREVGPGGPPSQHPVPASSGSGSDPL